jgi:hypothetical protein
MTLDRSVIDRLWGFRGAGCGALGAPGEVGVISVKPAD